MAASRRLLFISALLLRNHLQIEADVYPSWPSIASDVDVDPCDPRVYRVLDDPRRSVHYSSSSSTLCDDLLPQGWYRFLLHGMAREIANFCPVQNQRRCGAAAQVWLDVRDISRIGNVSAEACVSWEDIDCCLFTLPIKVRNCRHFNVYFLGPTQACPIAYCSAPPQSNELAQKSRDKSGKAERTDDKDQKDYFDNSDGSENSEDFVENIAISNNDNGDDLGLALQKPLVLVQKDKLRCQHGCQPCSVRWYVERRGHRSVLASNEDTLTNASLILGDNVFCELVHFSLGSLMSDAFRVDVDVDQTNFEVRHEEKSKNLIIKLGGSQQLCHEMEEMNDFKVQIQVDIATKDKRDAGLMLLPSCQFILSCSEPSASLELRPEPEVTEGFSRGNVVFKAKLSNNDLFGPKTFKVPYNIERLPVTFCHLLSGNSVVNFGGEVFREASGSRLFWANEDFEFYYKTRVIKDLSLICGLLIKEQDLLLSLDICNEVFFTNDNNEEEMKNFEIWSKLKMISSKTQNFESSLTRDNSSLILDFPSGRVITVHYSSTMQGLWASLQSAEIDKVGRSGRGLCAVGDYEEEDVKNSRITEMPDSIMASNNDSTATTPCKKSAFHSISRRFRLKPTKQFSPKVVEKETFSDFFDFNQANKPDFSPGINKNTNNNNSKECSDVLRHSKLANICDNDLVQLADRLCLQQTDFEQVLAILATECELRLIKNRHSNLLFEPYYNNENENNNNNNENNNNNNENSELSNLKKAMVCPTDCFHNGICEPEQGCICNPDHYGLHCKNEIAKMELLKVGENGLCDIRSTNCSLISILGNNLIANADCLLNDQRTKMVFISSQQVLCSTKMLIEQLTPLDHLNLNLSIIETSKNSHQGSSNTLNLAIFDSSCITCLNNDSQTIDNNSIQCRRREDVCLWNGNCLPSPLDHPADPCLKCGPRGQWAPRQRDARAVRESLNVLHGDRFLHQVHVSRPLLISSPPGSFLSEDGLLQWHAFSNHVDVANFTEYFVLEFVDQCGDTGLMEIAVNVVRCDCRHGGECFWRNDNTIACLCPRGYTGVDCGRREDACAVNLCENNSTCVAALTNDYGNNNNELINYFNDKSRNAESNYFCVCLPGFVGKYCEMRLNIDPCLSQPCYPGVTCFPLKEGYVCGKCPAGTTGNGEICDPIFALSNPCNFAETNPCFDKSLCRISAKNGKVFCEACPKGMRGDGIVCQLVNKNPCIPNPCHSQCTPVNGVATCGPCPSHLRGDGRICHEKDENLENFTNDINRNNPNNEVFKGDRNNAISEYDGCSSNPCHEGVSCRRVGKLGFQCGSCPQGMIGDGIDCTKIDPCNPNPCFRGVVCLTIWEGRRASFSCGLCPDGMVGDGKECVKTEVCEDEENCGKNSHFCRKNRLGGANCKNLRIQSNEVTPQKNGRGRLCRKKCRNGGVCSGRNRCKCRPQFRGRFCHKPRCRGGCRNGGTCVAPATCKCRKGYFGPNCRHALCSPKCLNGGRCVRPDLCRCRRNFFGPRCARHSKPKFANLVIN